MEYHHFLTGTVDHHKSSINGQFEIAMLSNLRVGDTVRSIHLVSPLATCIQVTQSKQYIDLLL